MIVSAFYTTIRNTLGRGSTQDANLPLWAAEACSLIEQDWSYGWMDRTGTVAVSAAALVPNQVAFPNARVKSFDFVKVLESTSPEGFTPQRELIGVDPKDVIGIEKGPPNAYWRDGVSYLYLDANTPVDITLFLAWREFTAWPTDTNAEPAILIRALSLMVSTTLMIAAQRLNDPRMEDRYANMAQVARNAAMQADMELRWKHQGDMRAEYQPAGGGLVRGY